MPARLTRAEAARLGLTTVSPAPHPPPRKKVPPRGTQRVLRAKYRSTCARCQTVCNSIADEDRHLTETGHNRYETL